MKILYVGDIMGGVGVDVVRRVLPDLRQSHNIDLVLAQAENVTGGKSIDKQDIKKLLDSGVDFFTGGNHTPKNKDIHALLEDSSQPIIGPANMKECPGKGWKYIQTPHGPVLVISILGEIFGRIKPDISNPLQAIDEILEENKGVKRVATIVNFHADYSSEKMIIGYYLDGKVSAVVGDHWHVPTADASVLPKGTAHITDVGMCGSLRSSLGIKLDVVIDRWRHAKVNRNELESDGDVQFNALLVNVDTKTGLARSAEHIRQILAQ